MTGLIDAGASELAASLARFVADGRLPGAAAGVVHCGQLAWSAEVGVADLATGQPTGPGMLYRIASITKTFTGTAIMRLRDEGLLDLEDPAVAYLPELRHAVSPFAAIETVTIRRMLSHESGLPSEPPGTDWSVPRYQGSAELNLARAGDIAVVMAPSTQHKYSDLAYQLLGEIVSRVTGVPYPRYLTESVLDPLEMTATGFEPLPGPLLGQRATGYGWRALSDDLDPAPPMSPIWAEGGLWSCVPDLARWISFQLAGYQQPPGDPPVLAAGSAPVLAVGTPPVLAAGSLRDMHRPRYLTDDTWTRAWGISWCATRRDDVTWIEHSGGLPGFTSTICFDPVTGVGAIVLINGTSGSVELGLNLASIARRLVSAAPPVIERPGPVPAEYRSLLGCYARPGFGGWILRLEWRSGRLTFTSADLASWSLALEPTADPDVFIAGPGSNFTGENVVFRRLADHRVTSVLLVESTFMRLDPVAAGPARSQAI